MPLEEKRRAPLFDRTCFEHSPVRTASVKVSRRTDARGPFFLLAFYTVPGEAREDVCRQMEE